MKFSYEIELTKSAVKEFKKLPKKIKEKVLETFSFLSLNPFSEILKVKKMKGPDSLYRVKLDNYRVVYEIQNKKIIIVIIKIGHRKDIYQKL